MKKQFITDLYKSINSINSQEHEEYLVIKDFCLATETLDFDFFYNLESDKKIENLANKYFNYEF